MNEHVFWYKMLKVASKEKKTTTLFYHWCHRKSLSQPFLVYVLAYELTHLGQATRFAEVPLLKTALCLMIRHKRHLTKWISPFTITGQEKLSQTHKLQTLASKIHSQFH